MTMQLTLPKMIEIIEYEPYALVRLAAPVVCPIHEFTIFDTGLVIPLETLRGVLAGLGLDYAELEPLDGFETITLH
jgi:hypothetical protein